MNDKPRTATCVAVGDVELLVIAKFNFKATGAHARHLLSLERRRSLLARRRI